MSIRKFRRGLARANMDAIGIKHYNREGTFNGSKFPSFFAQNWRQYETTPAQIERRRAAYRARKAARA